MRVVVADDDERFRTAVVEQLTAGRGVQVVEAADAAALLAVVAETAPDVVLLDVGMAPGGAATCAELLARDPGLAVVAISGRADAAAMRDLVAAGARAFLAKGAMSCSLVCYLDHAVQGDLLLVGEGADELRASLAAGAPAAGAPALREG